MKIDEGVNGKIHAKVRQMLISKANFFIDNLGKVGNVTCRFSWYFRVACRLKMYTWYRLRKRIFSSPCCPVVPHEAWLARLKRIVPFTVLGAKIQSSFIAEHCRALLSITEHGWALLSIARHCWALLSIAEHCWDAGKWWVFFSTIWEKLEMLHVRLFGTLEWLAS